jgi:meso-butanediol dehydrogenase / (S,S)-butanediol dehydrogenase / diacetyl reductase
VAGAVERMGERVLVSGATSGIGRAIAIRLAARATAIGVMGRRREAAEKVAAEVRQAGCEAVVLVADVGQASQVENAVNDFVAAYGGLETVVASAGITVTAPVKDFALGDWERIVATNLGGTFYLARFSLPHLLESKGTFTAISSDAGTHGAPGYGPYCATKHGVNGLIKCMALEYGRQGVRCNAICPGFVETPMAHRLFDNMSAAELKYYKNSVPLGRFASAAEVAAVVDHITSSEAGYTNGLLYALDGGSTAGYYSGPA